MEAEAQRQTEYIVKEQELTSISVQSEFQAEAKAILERNLSYQYPYAESGKIPSKISVSELKRMSKKEELEESAVLYPDETEYVPILPEFLQEKTEMTGVARGTIYHKIMEKISFEVEDMSVEIRKLEEKGILKKEELEAVDIRKLNGFRNSRLGRRMALAQKMGQLYREQQFVMETAASEVDPLWNSEEKILIQGIIDAYFIEENEIVLVDYKTDFVKFQEASSLYEKYRVQLGCYKNALETLTDYPVKEILIYSFCLDRELTGSE